MLHHKIHILKEKLMDKRSIVHIEISSTDRKVTSKFYAELFGWGHEHTEEPMPYTTFTTGNIGGGFTEPRDDFAIGSPLIYIESDDVAADLAKAEKLGGEKVSDPMDIPTVGTMAIFRDPSGNPIALFKGVEMEN